MSSETTDDENIKPRIWIPKYIVNKSESSYEWTVVESHPARWSKSSNVRLPRSELQLRHLPCHSLRSKRSMSLDCNGRPERINRVRFHDCERCRHSCSSHPRKLNCSYHKLPYPGSWGNRILRFRLLVWVCSLDSRSLALQWLHWRREGGMQRPRPKSIIRRWKRGSGRKGLL